jgi:two-component system, NarL family, nitrate/nitrite response regulator NarL
LSDLSADLVIAGDATQRTCAHGGLVATTIRVVIADDHPPTRAGVRRALEGHGFDVCAEVGTAPAAVEAARRCQPDLCILDIHMPGGGITAAAEIRDAVPAADVVMLTIAQGADIRLAALQAGAVGYLPKDTDPRRLPDLLRGVLSG